MTISICECRCIGICQVAAIIKTYSSCDVTCQIDEFFYSRTWRTHLDVHLSEHDNPLFKHERQFSGICKL